MLNILSICPANFKALFLPLFDNLPLNKGIKAALKAPSAKMLLKKFGNLKAILNASAKGPVPKNVAINISRMKPKILEIKVFLGFQKKKFLEIKKLLNNFLNLFDFFKYDICVS